MGKKFGFSWSWKRASGLSSVKQKIARATGVPTTRGGRQRKMGRLLGGFFWPWGAARRQAAPQPDADEQETSSGISSLIIGCLAVVGLLLVGTAGMVVLSVAAVLWRPGPTPPSPPPIAAPTAAPIEVAASSAAAKSLTPSKNPKLRTWRNHDGKFFVDAELVSVEGDNAVLKREDGTTVDVVVPFLHKEDREFISTRSASP